MSTNLFLSSATNLYDSTLYWQKITGEMDSVNLITKLDDSSYFFDNDVQQLYNNFNSKFIKHDNVIYKIHKIKHDGKKLIKDDYEYSIFCNAGNLICLQNVKKYLKISNDDLVKPINKLSAEENLKLWKSHKYVDWEAIARKYGDF